MIKPVTMYSVVCDRCGKTFGEDNDIIAWVDECTTREQAMESEWIEIGDKHYCPDCYEFNDELDEYVPKKGGDKEFIIKVVEHDENKMPCTGCFFNSDDIACGGNCSADERSDHKNVIFKQIKVWATNQEVDVKKDR